MSGDLLRVGVAGTGVMGFDHLVRLAERTRGAEVVAVVEPDPGRRAAALARAPGARGFDRFEDAIESGLDAVLIASPRDAHESAVTAALEARLWTFCEKPLAPDAGAVGRILEAEQRLDRPHLQVGFMRRFDAEYRGLRDLIATGSAGDLLLLHCVHRNPGARAGFTQEMLLTDSVVHELDIVPWLAGSPIRSIEIRHGRHNPLSAPLREPLLVLVELENGVLADVEINMSAQFGYQVATEAMFQRGVARIGQPAGLQLWQEGRVAVAEHQGFLSRFEAAYDVQIQAWVDAARRGKLGGPDAWTGYLAALAADAGIRAMRSGRREQVDPPPPPDFYTTVV